MRKAIFWDFDGTLVRHEHLWTDSFLKAAGPLAGRYGLTYERAHPYLTGGFPWDKDGCAGVTGKAWWDCMTGRFARAYQELGLSIDEAFQAAKNIRQIILSPENYKPYADAAPTLALCIYKGYKNYLLSNNFPELEELTKKLFLHPFFSGFIVSGVEGVNKPEEKIFRIAAQRANFPSLCYMVGDNPEADIGGGKRSGMKTVYVHGAEPCGADLSCETLTELLRHL